MTDFLIMSAAFLILIPSSWPNEINGLVMRMRKVFLIDLSHRPAHENSTGTSDYSQNMRRVGKPPYYVWGGQPAGLASPPIRRGCPRVALTLSANPDPTKAAPYRQALARRRLPPEQPTRRGDHPWLT
jgi:hypothetical protein